MECNILPRAVNPTPSSLCELVYARTLYFEFTPSVTGRSCLLLH